MPLAQIYARLYLINFDDDGHRSIERATFLKIWAPQ